MPKVDSPLQMNLKDTLNLPDPDFTIPMRANLSQREPEIQQKWSETGVYEAIQEARKDAKETFVLHDGPPYTNGPIHIGTALNKVLKDFVVKSQTLMGKRAPYVPGYDNHGLPIELAVQAKLAEKKITPTVVELRKACREHAQHFLDIQNAQFQRLGVFGMWDRPYVSMDFRYEAEIVRVFGRLVENGYVYRGLRPVLWSPTAQTALADTEIVYKNVTSKSIYVRFPLLEDPKGLLPAGAYCVIWTTTPWTIPANLAVAFHPDFDYALVKSGDAHYLLFEGLVDKTMAKFGITGFETVKTFKGSELEGTKFKHPIFDRESLAVLADYVTTEDGTGVVHTAPGHGRDDFYTGKKYGLPVLCPVNEKGVLTEEAGEFAGVYYKKCDTAVVDRLREVGHLLHVDDFLHSYPHAERDGNPVIFRATEQWFIGIDLPFHKDNSKTLRQRMLDEVERVSWHPVNGQKRMRTMIEGRPDWCISRQRPWGVGIPVFYGAKSGEPVLDPTAIEAVAKLIEQQGSDAWYSATPEEILPSGYKHPDTGETEFRKEVDVFDVWFDSGSTWACVLEGNVEPRWKEHIPCDIYLEGSDQHRGWFNVSLIIGTALTGGAPYDQVLTHGFVTAGDGVKMSKRLGNVIDPVSVCDSYGADILRLWVASVDATDDMPCNDEILKASGETYRRIRNALRFLLSNLFDVEDVTEVTRPQSSDPMDEWALDMTDWLVQKCLHCYKEYDFRQVHHEIDYFCSEYMSVLYLDYIKDAIYCDGKDWDTRRTKQGVCCYILHRLTCLVAPILMHTAEEVYERTPVSQAGRKLSIHAESLSLNSATRRDAESLRSGPFHDAMNRFLGLRAYEDSDNREGMRSSILANLEKRKVELGVKDSQDLDCFVTAEDSDLACLRVLESQLPLLLKVASCTISEGAFSIGFRQSTFEKCERSRIRRADVEPTQWNGSTVPLSARDRRALGV